jgi:hypothetical protein
MTLALRQALSTHNGSAPPPRARTGPSWPTALVVVLVVVQVAASAVLLLGRGSWLESPGWLGVLAGVA